MTARVLIVDDHALVAIGLQLALCARGWEVQTTDGPTASDVLDLARRFEPQVVLLDIDLGEEIGTGIHLIEPLRAAGALVVMLTAETRRAVLAACLEQGAAGWIGKGVFLDQVVNSLQDVLDGTPLIGCAAREAMLDELRIERAGMRKALTPFERLTMREREVLAALVDGLSAEEIAETQFVALTTVRSQIRAVLQKLGVRSQLAAVAHANRVGWTAARAQLTAA
jgi:two-component system nitrate/nitrite response regulator NarL